MSSSPIKRTGLWVILAGVAAGIAVVILVMRPSQPDTPPTAAGRSVAAPPKTPPAAVVELGPITVHQSANDLAAQLTRDGMNTEDRIEAINQIIYVYRQGFGGNPTGQNEDIVAAILGENEKRTALLPKDCPAIHDGKLVDEWGTPYWFHPITAKVMEIRSAGPDRDLFTNDDVFIQ